MNQPSILATLVCAGILGATPPALAQSELTPFVAAVDSSFAAWAGGRDGLLTAARVNRWLRDPHIKGEQAAALAVIHLYQRSHRGNDGKKDHPAVSLHFLEEHHPFEHAFERALKRIAAPRQLFVHELPSLEGLRQGPLGDCFFMSPLATAVHRDPEAVRDMIRPRKDGSYDVLFGDGEHIHVPALTDGMIALSSASGGNGLWPSVLEEAYGIHRLRTVDHRGDSSGLALDAINTGGGAKYPIQVFTGHKTRQVVLYHARFMSAERAARLERELRPILRRSSHRLVTTYTVGKNHPPNIAANHVYAILGFDAERNLVTVRNPWGQHFEPKDELPGLKNGYPTQAGTFKVPLREFVRIFSGVTYETGERLR